MWRARRAERTKKRAGEAQRARGPVAVLDQSPSLLHLALSMGRASSLQPWEKRPHLRQELSFFGLSTRDHTRAEREMGEPSLDDTTGSCEAASRIPQHFYIVFLMGA